MKKTLGLFFVLCLVLPAQAYELSDDIDTANKTANVVELRQLASANFALGKQWEIGVCEDIREVVYNSGVTPSAYFSKSYTSVEAGWKFFSYTDTYNNYKYSLKLNAGYTLRYLHPKQALRHRPYVSLSGSANFGPVKLTLRERFLADCRTDSVNVLEQPKCAMELRHRLTASFRIPGKTYRPFTFIELANTLNQPSCFNTSGVRLYGGQYLCAVRAKVGIEWKISAQHALIFSYGYHFSQSREVNITRKSQEINRLYMEQTHRHVISVAYEFGM